MSVIQKRYDFSLLFDVCNGNPNGDPDSDNMPRIDAETGIGLVTDVCLKRKVRDYAAVVKEGQPGYALYIASGRSLNKADLDAAEAAGLVPSGTTQESFKKELEKLKKSDPVGAEQKLKEAASAMYFDVRTFGAVMTSYQAAGAAQVRGPVQFGFAHSIDPIVIQDVGITRCVHATEKDTEEKAGSGTMGRKHIVPYALYRVDGYVSAALAEKYSGFNDDDLALLWDALMNMFEFDRSASRGNMASQKLVIFEHSNKFGNAPAHKLFELLRVSRKVGVEVARSYADYDVDLDMSGVPAGVTVTIRD